jgi:hypothetical protein
MLKKLSRIFLSLIYLFVLVGCFSDSASSENNPIVGNWIAEEEGAGYFEFTEDEFRWFKSQDDLEDNYVYGTYTYEAGALRHNGDFDYGEEGSEIFTIYKVNLRFVLDGEVFEDEDILEREGAFTIQRLDSKDSLFVLNHQTGSRFTINRIEE